MRQIMLRWPHTLSLPIMPTGAIPLHRDLIRTPNGCVVKPSEAHRYELEGTEGNRTDSSPLGRTRRQMA